ncbi:MAG: S8 family serine peptidase [Planctomycetes bacterium]|nr:S8 family serine peptidase [Planctomycetota bacterium]
MPAESVENFAACPEIVELRDAYIEAGVAGPGSLEDAEHVAAASVADVDVSPLEALLVAENVMLTPLFRESEDRLQVSAKAMAEASGEAVEDLSIFYSVAAANDRLDELAEQLLDQELVEAAYVKPAVEMPDMTDVNDMVPSAIDAPPASPDFNARQIYLNAAPAGIDARHAWTLPGGRGAGIRIIDIEGAWRFTHEDLVQNQGGVIGGTQSTNIGWRNHGTAVIGEFGGDRNGIGVEGICADANTRVISIFGGLGSAAAIRQAANALSAGDIILLELHRPGPRFNFQIRQDQRGYIAIEWWQDDFAAIRFATQRGVIVVEAAGNGAEDLDDRIYGQRPVGFPTSWTNPFNRNNRDSGAIVVGAGAPPPGTHGRNHGPDRSRLGFSNFGALVDTQGWGREVTTCAYGDLQGGANEDLWYTDRFSGTSSASPIVVGAAGSIQGVLRARNLTRFTPAQMRALLRSTGSPQTDAPGRPRTQRIGNRPDLRQMIARLPGGGGGGSPVRLAGLYRYWNSRIGDHFYTTNFRELGNGRHGWRLEGIQCYVFPRRHAGCVPLYRYWNPRIGDHFYTTNFRELGRGRYGWRYEGVQCYVRTRRTAGTIPLYRYWNPQIGDHFYTTNFRELGRGRYGWRYEGVQCYVYRQRLLTVPSADDEAQASLVPSTFMVEDDLATEPTVSFVPDCAEDVDNDEAISVLTGPAADESVDDCAPDSFTTSDDVADMAAGSFETVDTAESEDGDGFGPASFQAEAETGESGVTVNINVNKSN